MYFPIHKTDSSNIEGPYNSEVLKWSVHIERGVVFTVEGILTRSLYFNTVGLFCNPIYLMH